MKLKGNRYFKYNILLAIILLLVLLISSLSGTNSWFTYKQDNAVNVIIRVNNDKLVLVQKIDDTPANDIKLAENNLLFDEVLLPDSMREGNKPYDLKVALNNENDTLSLGLYIRFKFELYIQTTTLNETTGQPQVVDQAVAHTLGLGENFVKVSEDDGVYYYYKEGDKNKKMVGGDSLILFETLSIPDSSIFGSDNAILSGGENVKIVIVVEGALTEF